MIKRVSIISIVLLVATVVAWYEVSFSSYKSQLKEVISFSKVKYEPIEKKLYPLAVIAEEQQGIRAFAMRSAFFEYGYKENRSGNTAWHLNNTLWLAASYLNFSDREVFYLWCAFLPYEKGRGADLAALHYFNKDIELLTLREYAGLVAVARGPSVFKPGSQKYKDRVDLILSKFRH